MATADLLRKIGNNARKYAQNFRATGDLAWLARFAQESRFIQGLKDVKRPKGNGYYEPLTIGDFEQALEKANAEPLKDPIQSELNHLTVNALSRVYETLDPFTSAFKTSNLVGVDEALADDLLIDTDDKMSRLRVAFQDELARSTAPVEVREKLTAIAGSDDHLSNAAMYVLTKAYIYAYEWNLWKNPLLTILPSEQLTKSAARSDPDVEKHRNMTPAKQGPRLSDLISGLKLVSGKYAQELAGILRQEANLAAAKYPPRKEVLKALADKKKSVVNTIVVLDAYIDYSSRMASGLKKFMAEDTSRQWIKWGEGARDFITEDPLIASSVDNPANFAQFFRSPLSHKERESDPDPKKKRFGHEASFDVETWNGEKVKFGSGFDLDQTHMAKFYVPFHMKKPEYAAALSSSLIDNSQKFLAYYRSEREFENIAKLRQMTGLPQLEAQKMFDYIMRVLTSAVPPVPPELAAKASQEADVDDFLKQAGVDIDPATVYEMKLTESISKAKTAIFDKYKDILSGKADVFMKFLDELLAREIIPLSPLDIKNMSARVYYKFPETAPGAVKPRTNEVSQVMSGDKKEPDLYPGIMSHLQDVFKSRHFQNKFKDNKSDIVSYEESHTADALHEHSKFLGKIKSGVDRLISPESKEIKDMLGLEIPATTDYNEFTKAFNVMAAQVLTISPDTLQGLLGDIPIESLSAYVSRQFLVGAEAHIACILACKFDGAREEQAKAQEIEGTSTPIGQGEPGFDCPPCDGRPISKESYNEVVGYINKRLLGYEESILGKRGEGRRKLATDTGAGAVDDWRRDEPGTIRSGAGVANFAGFYIERAAAGFGTYLRDQGEARIRKMLNRNKDERDAAGDKFNWKADKPTSWAELMDITGAFADPDPRSSKEGDSLGHILQKELSSSVPLEQMEELSPAELAARSRDTDTAEKHIKRLVSMRLGFADLEQDPIYVLRTLFRSREAQLIEKDERYASLIVPFDKSRTRTITGKDGKPKTVYETNDPFGFGIIAPPKSIDQKGENNGFQISSRDDAFKFIDALPRELLDSTSAGRIKAYITQTKVSPRDEVFASTVAFFDYFSAIIGPILETDGKDVVAILNHLIPGRARPRPQTVDHDVLAFQDQLTEAIKSIITLIESPIPSSQEELGKQILIMQQSITSATEMIKRISVLPDRAKVHLATKEMQLRQLTQKLQDEAQTRQQRLEEQHMSMQQSSIRPVQDRVEEIMALIASPDIRVIDQKTKKNWPQHMKELAFESMFRSLVGEGKPGAEIPPDNTDAIQRGFEILTQFLTLLKTHKAITVEQLTKFQTEYLSKVRRNYLEREMEYMQITPVVREK